MDLAPKIERVQQEMAQLANQITLGERQLQSMRERLAALGGRLEALREVTAEETDPPPGDAADADGVARPRGRERRLAAVASAPAPAP